MQKPQLSGIFSPKMVVVKIKLMLDSSILERPAKFYRPCVQNASEL